MKGSNCFYWHRIEYRGHLASLQLRRPVAGNPWAAEQRTTISGSSYGFVSIQQLEPGITLSELLVIFQARVELLVDCHLASESSR